MNQIMIERSTTDQQISVKYEGTRIDVHFCGSMLFISGYTTADSFKHGIWIYLDRFQGVKLINFMNGREVLLDEKNGGRILSGHSEGNGGKTSDGLPNVEKAG